MLPRKSGIGPKETKYNTKPHDWEPKIFKRKTEAPALHELLQNPSILEVTPIGAWPLGWRPVSVTPRRGGMNTLHPIVEIGGDFSSVAVMLCPECGHVLRGLGKGIPVVCMECGFPCTKLDLGWRREG